MSEEKVKEALAKLKDGNKRFIEGKLTGDISPARRESLVNGQHPFATILCCSDSRVPPELIFDQGLGNLFIIRTAGNIVGDIDMGSLEYGGGHCHTPLLVVLGHSNCGAVTAACTDPDQPAHINYITGDIQASVNSVKSGNPDAAGPALVDLVMRDNIKRMMDKVQNSSNILAMELKAGNIKMMGAVYSLQTGVVDFWE